MCSSTLTTEDIENDLVVTAPSGTTPVFLTRPRHSPKPIAIQPLD